ncbi:MAG: S8 family peptidase [Bacteroidia bacterium]
MTKTNYLIAFLLVFTAGATNSLGQGNRGYQLPKGVTETDMVSGTLIFKLKPEHRLSAKVNGVDLNALNQALASVGATAIQKVFPAKKSPAQERNALGQKMVDLSLIYEVQYNSSVSPEKAANALLRTGLVEYAEPKFLPRLLFTPNDPSLSQQYHLTKIQAFTAWDIQQGDTSVVIGITDTGGDLDHPDMVANMKINYNDPADGIDNDNDGYVDNWRGWDLGENDNNPSVTSASSHGSHVAGCASSVTNNNVGVAAPGFNCKYLPVKISNASGSLTKAYEGITYAADAGCQIINCSWGGAGGGSFGQDVIDYATINMNALVVASAGNDNSENSFFPASYRYVLSVASTGNNDTKSSFSNYGPFIDVCAPGSNIYAAQSNNTYQLQSGTSMASPVAAGAAAIIKSQFPSYTALQVGEKLRVTCDNIYGVSGNSAYLNKLGKGRINMYRSLTINSPAVRMMEFVTTDNNDNAFVVGDTLRITSDITNYLDPTSNLVITMSVTSPWVTILDNSTTVGTLGTLATVNNNGDPFQVKINPNTPLNTKVTFRFTLTDGAYTDVQLYDVVLNVDYINVTVNQVATTITSKGRIGYNGTGQTEGLGFTYNGENLLYEAGLMIGKSSSAVSDNVRNDTGTDEDYQSTQVVQKLMPTVQSEFDLFGKFNDTPSASPLPVLVSHKALAWSNPGDDKYVIVEYSIKNTSTSTLSNLYAGVFADWDIQDYSLNKADENTALKMGYVYNTTATGLWAGIKLLTATPFKHYAIDNIAGGGGANLSDGYNTAEKYTTLSTNRATAGGTGSGNDVIDVVSSGPFTIAAGDSVRVAFALIAGDDLNDLNTSAGNAQIKYDGLFTSVPSAVTGGSGLLIAPNPVSEMLQLLHREGKRIESIQVIDVTGRIVSSPILMGNSISVASLPSGTYFLQAVVEGQIITSRFVKE